MSILPSEQQVSRGNVSAKLLLIVAIAFIAAHQPAAAEHGSTPGGNRCPIDSTGYLVITKNAAPPSEPNTEEYQDHEALVRDLPFVFGEYRFNSVVPGRSPCNEYAGDRPERIEIYRRQRRILSLRNDQPTEYQHIWLSFPRSNVTYRAPKRFAARTLEDVIGRNSVKVKNPFMDINGDHVPDVILWEWTGGMHCCDDYGIYSLGAKPRLYGVLHSLDSSFIFADLDGDKKYEAVGFDCNFRYWCTSFGYSPAPLIILTPTVHGFKLASRFMKTPPADESQLQAMVNECRKEIGEPTLQYHDNSNEPPEKVFSPTPLIWRSMLNLIYTGNSMQAWTFLDRVWTGKLRCSLYYNQNVTKKEFVREFLTQLSHSLYWKSIRQLNSNDRRLSVH